MTRTELLTTTALIMTPAERAKGRFMRAPDDHGGAPAPSPAPAPTPAPVEAAPDAGGEPEDTRSEEEILNDEFETPAEEALADDDVEVPPVKEEPKPGEPSVEERIGELTRTAREAERAAAEARRDAEEWRRRAEAATPPTGDDVDPDAAPAPEDYEFGEADSKYIADLAVHAARQEVRTQAEAAEVKAMFTDLEAKWAGEIAKPEVAEKYPDFDEKVTKGAVDQKWDCSAAMAVGIKQSPVGIDVAYHLASDPVEASRISRLPLMDQVLEFGRIEGRYLAAAETKAEPVPVTPTKAPNPPAARTRGVGGQFATEADTDDFGSFDKMADGLIRHKG